MASSEECIRQLRRIENDPMVERRHRNTAREAVRLLQEQEERDKYLLGQCEEVNETNHQLREQIKYLKHCGA